MAQGIQLVLDYGPATLEAFRIRTQALGCSLCTWCTPATLTIQAATTEGCHCDLDYAVSVQLSLMALRGLVRRKLAQSLTIPSQPADTDAPHVAIIGRGINGLLQAVMLRIANYQVTVYGGHQQGDGASHKRINMRHMSATETTAKPLENDYLLPGNQCLAIECNRAGIELFEKLLADTDAEPIHLKSEIEVLLQDSGVQFKPAHLSSAQIDELSRQHFVMVLGDVGAGLSIVYCSAYHRIAAGGTYAAGTTLGLVWALLVQEIIQAN
ncbi:hypothetical protein ACW9IB_17455 [Pseudomonas sp. SDO524_S393]